MNCLIARTVVKKKFGQQLNKNGGMRLRVEIYGPLLFAAVLADEKKEQE